MSRDPDQFLLAPRGRYSRKKPITHLSILLLLSLILFSPLGAVPALAVEAPVLLSPGDGITVRATAYAGALAVPPLAVPSFEWQAVPGASNYTLEVSQDVNFITRHTFLISLTTYTPTIVGNFSDGRWYWRVKVNASGAPYSEIWSFWREWASPDNYPVLLQPENGASLEFFDSPNFSWQPVLGAAKYRLQISGNLDFTAIAYTNEVLSTTFQPPVKLVNGDYFWRVIPLDPSSRLGAFSEVRSFSMGYNRIPVLIEPVSGSFPTFTPTFRWQAVRGAQQYILEYSTSSTFGAGTTRIYTSNTTFTPQSTLPNDINYYWHVGTKSGNSLSGWSPTWNFQKRWYLVPTLLTPTNNFPYVRFPFFSWTPVPGAARYRIQIDKDPDFANLYIDEYTSNPFYTPRIWDGIPGSRYWRVIPYDGSDKEGQKSAEWSFQNSSLFATPVQIYPLYYYSPDTALNPHADRTVPFPLFMWNRLTEFPSGVPGAVEYEVQLCSDGLCNSPVWSEHTQNLHAAPNISNPFTPSPGADYWWRVRGLDKDGNLVGDGWSQVWRARFDPELLMDAAPGSPLPLRPVHAAETVDQTPLFEWRPVTGADYYEVNIFDDLAMIGEPVLSGETIYPAFSPTTSLAQRSLVSEDPSKLAFGTFYWQVRAYTAAGFSAWSSPLRFQIAAQSEWLGARTLGAAALPYQVAADPLDAADPNYELNRLFVTQDTDLWYFGFDAFTDAAADMVYAILLDLDHIDGSGATALPAPFDSLATNAAHRPEYAVLVEQAAGNFDPAGVGIYTWTGSGWSLPAPLSQGGILYNTTEHYLELALHNTAIGFTTSGGSYAVSLLSLPLSGGDPLDSVPSDPGLPGGAIVSHFASVSQRMNPRLPPSNLSGDPTATPFAPLFFWDFPSGSNGTDPWAGARMEYHFDPGFTNKIGQFDLISTTAYYCPTSYTWPSDLSGNNTYYWRIQPRYPGNSYGVWSQGWRFELRNFVPQNLVESTTFTTPSFQWDHVEGAEFYDLQVSKNTAFTDLVTNISTTQNSFTPTTTFDNNRTYYWRVRAARDGVPAQDYWSEISSFDLNMPIPTGLSPNDPDPGHAVHRAPTFCWTPLVAFLGSQPVLAAYQYELQVSLNDPTFSVKTIYTTEQSCFTPPEGYADGTYYWRAAMRDGQGKIGGFSGTAIITKQYPVTTLISPSDGTVLSTPTFTWTPVDGAASYKFEVSINPNFSPIYDSASTNQTTFTPTRVYASNQTFYWRVAIVDAQGKVGPFTGGTILINPYANGGFLPIVIR